MASSFGIASISCGPSGEVAGVRGRRGGGWRRRRGLWRKIRRTLFKVRSQTEKFHFFHFEQIDSDNVDLPRSSMRRQGCLLSNAFYVLLDQCCRRKLTKSTTPYTKRALVALSSLFICSLQWSLKLFLQHFEYLHFSFPNPEIVNISFVFLCFPCFFWRLLGQLPWSQHGRCKELRLGCPRLRCAKRLAQGRGAFWRATGRGPVTDANL